MCSGRMKRWQMDSAMGVYRSQSADWTEMRCFKNNESDGAVADELHHQLFSQFFSVQMVLSRASKVTTRLRPGLELCSCPVFVDLGSFEFIFARFSTAVGLAIASFAPQSKQDSGNVRMESRSQGESSFPTFPKEIQRRCPGACPRHITDLHHQAQAIATATPEEYCPSRHR